jgi:aspartate/methionine/tyrosine aminotransferase
VYLDLLGSMAMSFSSRTPALEPNRLSEALLRLRREGAVLIDLTETNPTTVGLSYPVGLLDGLADPRGLRYEPAAFGLRAARGAVAKDLGRHGPPPDPDRIILTASTSEAYSYLFKLLCDPGDEVLVPRPSYPLFEHLTRLDGVVPVAYRLELHARWWIDVAELERVVTPRTRVLVVVNPNNPTGSVVTPEEAAALADLCRRHSLAVISDEVFADFPLETPPAASKTLSDTPGVLTFVLGGLSKSVGLPQVKLAWIVASGPEAQTTRALQRLELIADTYLSVSSAVQHAAAGLLSLGSSIRDEIRRRVAGNYGVLRRLVTAAPACRVLPVEAGWAAVVRVPAIRMEEQLALELLTEDGVLVHPGYFFDFESEAFVVVSLLPDPTLFETGMRTVLARAAGEVECP